MQLRWQCVDVDQGYQKGVKRSSPGSLLLADGSDYAALDMWMVWSKGG